MKLQPLILINAVGLTRKLLRYRAAARAAGEFGLGSRA